MKRDRGQDTDFYRLSKFDVILIALILLLSMASIPGLTMGSRQQSSDSKVARISLGGKLQEGINLNQDTTVNLPNDIIQIEVKAGKIRVAHSHCPNQICVNMGWIETPGQVLACVPNKVLVEIESADPPFLDAVVY